MARYADGPTMTAETTIDAPPSIVWALVSDIGLPAQFSDELQRAEWVVGTRRPELGAQFEGHNRHAKYEFEWTTTSTVCELEPERRFGWYVGDEAAPAASWRFELEPTDGGTLLRQWARMGPGPSGLAGAIEAQPDKEERIVAQRLEEWRTNMEATVAGVKRLAEASE